MSKFIVKTVDIVFVFFMGILLFAFGTYVIEFATDLPKAPLFGIIVLFCVFASLFLLRNTIKNIAKKIYYCLINIPCWKLALILGAVSVVTKLFFVFLFDMNTDNHEDMRMYRSFAKQYAENGFITENADYALRYKYTVIYGLFLSQFAKIFGSDPKVFTGAISVLVSIAIVLLFDIIRKYTGKEIAFAGLFAYIILPLGLFQTQLINHENTLLFFHISSFWFYQKVFEQKYSRVIRVLFLFISGILISIGKSINTSGQVMVISFGIYALAKIFANGFTLRKAMQFLCVVLILAICFTGLTILTDLIHENTVEKSGTDAKRLKSIPYGWVIYLGHNLETRGSWNREDYNTYYAYRELETQEEANEYQKKVILDRLQEYFDSPHKFLILYFYKIIRLLCAPYLGAANEWGSWATIFYSRGINGWVFKSNMLITVMSSMYIYAILFLSKLSRIRKKATDILPDTHFQMVVFGVCLILLLIGEVTSKYAIHLHILIVAASLFSVKSYFTDSIVYNTNHKVQKQINA